ncbi:MAG: hypothetical protein H6730_20320 [Deltaproteobacteria bacterium]|nr:hypothetical protein [Deltaproteobacteria bacterium]
MAKQEKLRGVPLVRRMHRRLDKDTLRLLPLDLAMEGFLGLCFSGPDVAWRAYSEQAIRGGLGCRSERVYSADEVDLLDEAVRTFEIQHGQVGVLLFVSEGLAAAFVTPNADDYRRLHASLLNDFFGDVVVHYARLPPFQLEVPGSDRPVADLDQIALRVGEVRHAWQVYGRAQADGLLDAPLFQERVRKMHGFELRRFPDRAVAGRGEPHRGGDRGSGGAAGLPEDVSTLDRPVPAGPAAPRAAGPVLEPRGHRPGRGDLHGRAGGALRALRVRLPVEGRGAASGPAPVSCAGRR